MDVTLFTQKATEAASLLTAMANRNRLLILCLLKEEELTVTQLGEKIGIAQSPLSQHLAKLREKQLVKTRRAGQSIYYSLEASEVRSLLETLYAIYGPPGT